MKNNSNTRYFSEEDVKRALNISSFRNLSKDKVMQFASMIPYMDRDVAIALVNQFPVYADFGKAAIEQYMGTCKQILESNRESQNSVVKGYQTILDALSKRLDRELDDTERKDITNDMINVADKIAEADRLNKQYLDRTNTIIGAVVFTLFVLIAAALGVNIKDSLSGGNGKA